MGKEFEVRFITDPEAFGDYLKALVEAMTRPETKYNFQVKIKDVEFAVGEEKVEALGVTLSAGDIDEAELLLQEGVDHTVTKAAVANWGRVKFQNLMAGIILLNKLGRGDHLRLR